MALEELSTDTDATYTRRKPSGKKLSLGVQVMAGLLFFLGLLPVYMGLPVLGNGAKVLTSYIPMLDVALDAMQAYPILLVLAACAQAYVLLELYMGRALWWLALVPPTVCFTVLPVLGKKKMVEDLVRLTTPKFTEVSTSEASPAAAFLHSHFYTRSPAHAIEKGIWIRNLQVKNLDTDIDPTRYIQAAWLERRRRVTPDGYLDYTVTAVPQQALLAVAFNPEIPQTMREQLANKWGNRYYHYVPETGVMYWVPRWQDVADTNLNLLLLRTSAKSTAAHIDLVRSKPHTARMNRPLWIKTGETALLTNDTGSILLERVYEIYNEQTKETWQMAEFRVSKGAEAPVSFSICIDKACGRLLPLTAKTQLRIIAAVENDLNVVIEAAR